MASIWFYTIVSVILVSLVSLAGIFVVTLNTQRLKKMIFFLVSLAVGGLFGDTFIHLLPEAFADSRRSGRSALFILLGIFSFFILEKFLRWRHEHTISDEAHIHPLGYINLVADGVHNLIDGIVIAAAYLASIPVGIATTLAVILHEIPQEIGDFGILLHAGFKKSQALAFNFISASISIVGAVLALLLGVKSQSFPSLVIPFTAGGFIYIAGSDLLPELHKEINPWQSLQQLAAMAIGVGLMWLLTLVA